MLMFLISCKESELLYFTGPQPEKVRNKRSFKKKFTGTYECEKDSVKIFIGRGLVVRQIRYREKESQEKVDSMDLEIRNGYLIVSDDLPGGVFVDSVPVRFLGDSVEIVVDETDTLFDPGRGDILRYYKKTYYLNTRAGNGFWTVRTLGLEKRYTNNGADREKVLALHRFYEVKKKNNLLTRMEFGGALKSVDMGDRGKAFSPTRKQLPALMATKAYRQEYVCRKIKKGSGTKQ
jgi:hypothetical protein